MSAHVVRGTRSALLGDDRGERQESSIAAQVHDVLMERILGAGDVTVGPVAEEHARIVVAFERDDLRAAIQAIRDHVDTGKRVAVAAIEQAGGSL